MLWLWLGFFAVVAVVLALQRRTASSTVRSSVYWSLGCGALGLLFAVVLYVTYEHGPAGGEGARHSGVDAAAMYLSAYLLECALAFDTLFVIALLFRAHQVRSTAQPRLLWWALVCTIVLRVIILVGSAYVSKAFDGLLYLFGGYLVYQGLKCLRDDTEDEVDEGGVAFRILRRLRVAPGDHGEKFFVNGALTAAAVCLLTIVFTESVFAIDSVAALSISQSAFIVVTSNVLATMGMRSLYFVLASTNANAKLSHLRPAIAVLLMLTGAKMLSHKHVHVHPVAMLVLIATVISAGIAASVLTARRALRRS